LDDTGGPPTYETPPEGPELTPENEKPDVLVVTPPEELLEA